MGQKASRRRSASATAAAAAAGAALPAAAGPGSYTAQQSAPARRPEQRQQPAGVHFNPPSQPQPRRQQPAPQQQGAGAGPVRCPRCRRLLQPPSGHPRFLCPCGQMLMSPQAVQPQVRVMCPQCHVTLVPPAGAPIFRCPCGMHLRAPAAGAQPTSQGGGAKTSGMESAVVAQLLKLRGPRKWMRQALPGDRTLGWRRLLSDEETSELAAREKQSLEGLKEGALQGDSVKSLQSKLDKLGLGSADCVEKFELVEKLVEAEALFAAMPVKELKHRMDAMGADYTDCVEKEELVTRLITTALHGGAGGLFDDGFVRRFVPPLARPSLEWTRASEFTMDASVQGLQLSAGELQATAALPFREKMAWFKRNIAQVRTKWEQGHVRVRVRRGQLLEDSFNSFLKLKRDDMRRYFRFEFIGEPGIDAGGVAREWFHLLFDMLFNVDFGLFEYSGVDNICYQVNPSSGIANDLHLQYFQFAGRLLGKALFDGQNCTAHVIKPIYKHILAWPITAEDLEYVDAQVFKSMNDIRACEDVSYICLDFTTAVREFGVTKTIPLKPGGEDIEVTNENRDEYLNLLLKHIMLQRVDAQMAHFLTGLYEVVPLPLLSVFDYQELELLLCGLPSIEVDDWAGSSRYRGAYASQGSNHKVVKWFWGMVRDLSEEHRAKLLQFATGTSRVPVQGFQALQGNDGNIKLFTIDSVKFEDSVFPKAHTCFNRIELPIYPDPETMKKFVLQAIALEACGFQIE